jgi:hypothetical protein
MRRVIAREEVDRRLRDWIASPVVIFNAKETYSNLAVNGFITPDLKTAR